MLTRIRQRLSGLPRKAWLAIGGLSVVLAALVAVLVTLNPLDGPFESLSAGNPTFAHPDGLVVRLGEGSPAAQVQVTTIPREAFVAGQAGANWQSAHKMLPARLTPLSPIYTVKVRKGQVAAEMAIPNGADPLMLLDLYSWDEKAHAWGFVPSQLDVAQQVIRFKVDSPLTSVMAVHVQPGSPVAAVMIKPGGADLGSKFGLAIPVGITLDAQGQISGQPATAGGAKVMPLIRRRDVGAVTYSDPGQVSALVSQLKQVVLPYAGLVLDFDPGAGFTEFVATLAKEIHAHNKRVDIVIRGSSLENYDISGLAHNADRLWLAPGDNPELYLPHGAAETAIAALVRMMERSRLGLMVSALDVDVSGDTVKSVPSSEALASFGNITPEAGYVTNLAPGDSLAVRLSGQVTSMGFDDPLAMSYLTYGDATGQLHYVYFVSAQALERRLAVAGQYGLGAVAVDGLANPGAPANLADGLTAFLSQKQLGQAEIDQLAWAVKGPDGSQVGRQTGDLTLIQYLWQAATNPGEYIVMASLVNQSTSQPISTLVVNVGEHSAPAAAPSGTPTPTPAP
jgi:hypothetical protein